jgi:hypothetical protein
MTKTQAQEILKWIEGETIKPISLNMTDGKTYTIAEIEAIAGWCSCGGELPCTDPAAHFEMPKPGHDAEGFNLCGMVEASICPDCGDKAEACDECKAEVDPSEACDECGRHMDEHDLRESAGCDFMTGACVHGTRAGYSCDRCGTHENERRGATMQGGR